jgi:hypothetical protein
MANFDVNFTTASIVVGGGANSVLEYFEYRAIKSVGRSLHTDGNWYVIINFFANDVLNPLRLNLSQVTNQPTWTNDSSGSYAAAADIQRNIDLYITSATITGPFGSQDLASSVSVALSYEQMTQSITPNIISVGSANGDLGVACRSISFASNGTADARVSFNGGLTYVNLPAGTSINMDAGGIANEYPAALFYWDTTTNAGSQLIITYNI